ncbi:MAG: hypothetical protein HYY86_02835 [Candidatus Harrisonbacteria bacterium]|nr:hypothetical protein [Candidatus Harrisonbacteria bacterium]
MTRKLPKNYNRILLEALSAKPIAFNPLLAELAKSANAGLFMSQLLFWWEKGKKVGWIYKTIKEMSQETKLTRGEQDTAIKKWKQLGILEVKKEGVPPKRHFKINVIKLLELLRKTNAQPSEATNQFVETNKTNCNYGQNITENNPENTVK